MITKKRWVTIACAYYFFLIVNPLIIILVVSSILEKIFTHIADGVVVVWLWSRRITNLDGLQDYLKEQRDELTRKGKW